jgi:hypothetical protein
LLIIYQHTKATGLKPVVSFSFLGGQYYIFYFFIFNFFRGIHGKANDIFMHPDAANADFFWQQQARGPKNII